MWKYFLARLKEKSTWFSLGTVALGAISTTFTPEHSNAISNAVIAVITAIATFSKTEKGKK